MVDVRQSILSRRLREMEARLGAQLFERTHGRTHATSAGRDFQVSALRNEYRFFCLKLTRVRDASDRPL
jgi:DNA-binding transcriptional LysR family regulator